MQQFMEDEEFAKGTRIQLGTIRCMIAHAERCTVEIRSKNKRSINDPQADLEITAKLKIRDFTAPSWEENGTGAGRKEVRVIVDLSNHQLLWKNEDLKIVNKDEILDGIQELLTGAKRERIAFNPAHRAEQPKSPEEIS
jgi:hypothetical protein